MRAQRDGDAYPEFREDTDGVATTVLYERPGNDFHRVGDGAERPALDACYAPCLCVEADADCHLGRTATGCKDRVEEDVARDGHRVREVAVDLVEDILRRTAEQDRASFWCCALGEEGKVSRSKVSTRMHRQCMG